MVFLVEKLKSTLRLIEPTKTVFLDLTQDPRGLDKKLDPRKMVLLDLQALESTLTFELKIAAWTYLVLALVR